MTSLMGCDILSINDINPYTETGTFGISWNGGYKPDPTLEYLPPDDNTVPSFSENSIGELPLFAIPPNVYLKTSEARRYNVLEGGIPPRNYEFDDGTVEVQQPQFDVVPVAAKENVDVDVKLESTIWDRFLVGIIIALLIVFFLSMKRS